jgi:hypothetical protein
MHPLHLKLSFSMISDNQLGDIFSVTSSATGM